MADLSKLPNEGYFVGLVKKVSFKNDNIFVKLDIQGHSYQRNFWNPNADIKFLNETGYTPTNYESLIGKYCICSKKCYQGKEYLYISTISDTESEAYYLIDREDEFETAKERMKNQILDILNKIVNKSKFDFVETGRDLRHCVRIIEEYYKRRNRGQFGVH